jgi:hypothetical protein
MAMIRITIRTALRKLRAWGTRRKMRIGRTIRTTYLAAALPALLVLLAAFTLGAAAPFEAAAAAPPQRPEHPAQGARALRNDDVVAMTKANLGGDLIILAIERSPTLFTTTPEALIALKNQGVGVAVIAAMLKANGAGAGEAPRAADYLDHQPGVRLMRDGNPVRLQKAAYRIQGPSAWRAMVPGQHLASAVLFQGARAAIRAATATPIFEVRFPASLQIAGSIFLSPLKPDGGYRELERDVENPWRHGTKSPRGDLRLAVEAASIDQAANYGLSLYIVRPESALPPGEYVLGLGAGPDYYDFAVDP